MGNEQGNRQMVNRQAAEANSVLEMAILSVIGDRKDQQDTFVYHMTDGGGIFAVCDGMGGHEGGQLASRTAADYLLECCGLDRLPEDPMPLLLETARGMDRRVSQLSYPDGTPMKAGTTMAAVVVQDQQLYWISVGDSRVYLKRGHEFLQVTFDHIYQSVLDENLEAGEITRQEYETESQRGEALISFIGLGELKLIDYNDTPLSLQKDDLILIMSDGLYKMVTDEEINRIIENFSNIKEALQALDMKAQKNAKNRALSRDNMTAALIKIK